MSNWNKQHIKKGRMVAHRPKLSDKTRIGQVVEVNDKTVTVDFAEGIKEVMLDDLTPIFSTIAP